MKFETISDLEDITFHLECATAALLAVHTAMEKGFSAVETYVPALFCIWDYQSDVVKQLQQIVDTEPGTKQEVAQ